MRAVSQSRFSSLLVVAALSLTAAACANILGFEDLTDTGGTADGGPNGGDGGTSDGATGEGGSLPGFDAPTAVTAAAVPCEVGTLVTGSCDGGSICNPTSIAVDDADQIYVVDQSDVIHRVSPAGTVTALAPTHADGGAATFNQPSAVAFSHDDDSLYVADKYSVQHIALASGTTTPVAGSATFGHADDAGVKATFAGINALAIEPGGTDVWIADHNDVRVIALPGDPVDTITNGDRGLPQGIVANRGTVYFSTTNGMAIPAGIYDFSGGAVATISPYTTDLSFPGSLATRNDVLYAVNGNSAAVFRMDLHATTVTPQLLAGGVTGATAVDGVCTGTARFGQPEGLAVGGAGTIYVADKIVSRIRTITTGFGELTVSWTPPAPPPGRSIDGYTARAKLAGSVVSSCTTTTATSCTIGGLTSGTAYDVTVVATSGSDSSAESVPAPATPN